MHLWQVALGLCCCSFKTDAFAAVRRAAYSIQHEFCTSMFESKLCVCQLVYIIVGVRMPVWLVVVQ
jgi:hypothetical protein